MRKKVNGCNLLERDIRWLVATAVLSTVLTSNLKKVVTGDLYFLGSSETTEQLGRYEDIKTYENSL